MFISDSDSSRTPFGVPQFELNYTSDSDPTSAEKHFGIDKYSGVISLRYPLDYEARTQFILVGE